MKIRRLAIDQSSSICGWAVMDDDKLIDYGAIKIEDAKKKLTFLFWGVSQLIRNFQPDMVCWEDLKTSRNPDTIRKLGEITGVLRYLCQETEMPYEEVIPISVKATFCKKKGSGKRGKKTKLDLAKEICPKYNIDIPVKKSGKNKGQMITDESNEFFNITDAISIALYFHLKEDKIV